MDALTFATYTFEYINCFYIYLICLANCIKREKEKKRAISLLLLALTKFLKFSTFDFFMYVSYIFSFLTRSVQTGVFRIRSIPIYENFS